MGAALFHDKAGGQRHNRLIFCSPFPRLGRFATQTRCTPFASETDRVQAALIEAGKISARQEAIITPTNEREIAPIVVHRLFQSVDREAALEAGQAYRDYYEDQIGKGVELPEQAVRAEYRDEIATNYPFSPELITTLSGLKPYSCIGLLNRASRPPCGGVD